MDSNPKVWLEIKIGEKDKPENEQHVVGKI